MGSQISSSLRIKSRSSSDLDRIRPTAEQRTPKTRSKLASIALSSSRQLSKISFKRKSGSRDNAKSFHELISTWPLSDVEALFRELDTSRVLNIIKEDSDEARPAVQSIGEQMLLSETQNLVLVYEGVRYDVHRCIVSVRCDRIRQMLQEMDCCQKELSLTSPHRFSETDFSAFLTYLYSEQWDGRSDTLNELKNWLGCHRSLHEDLLQLEDIGRIEGDLTIVLTSGQVLSGQSNATIPEYTIRCHSELVSARSSFLKRLILKSPSRIVLDEALLPRGFVPLVFHFLYTDELDLKKVSDTSISQSSLSEARAIVAGRSPHSPLHRAIQLVHVAMFFSLNRLAQLCEDVMVSSLCIESCVSILSWALDGGSPYVARQAQRFLESEFSKIASTHHLFDISLESMVACVESQFVQATEVEILDCVVRWGEHELLKRMEDREPNIVADTSHSISRRGVKRSELSGEELNAIITPLTQRIRTDYVLPPFHQSLNNAYRRGILERAPLKDLVCPSTSEINPDIHWFRPGQSAPGPRFYLPYFNTTKTHLLRSLDNFESVRGAYLSNAANLRVEVENRMPEILDEELFQKVRSRIVEKISRLDKLYQIRFFPRHFHRKYAIEMISLGVVREMEIDADCVTVHLPSEPSIVERGGGAMEEVPMLSHASQPSLHWPDIMTLERKKGQQQQSEEQASGDYDPTPDDESEEEVRFGSIAANNF